MIYRTIYAQKEEVEERRHHGQIGSPGAPPLHAGLCAGDRTCQGQPGLWLAMGHGHLGLTDSVGTALRVTQQIFSARPSASSARAA